MNQWATEKKQRQILPKPKNSDTKIRRRKYVRKIFLLQEAGVFVNSYTEVNNLMVTKDEITVITSGILKVMNVKYDRELLSGEEGTLFRAKIKASIDTDGISKWLNMQASERASLVAQNKELQAAIVAQNQKIAELKRQLEDKSSNHNADYFKKEFNDVDNEFLFNQKIDAGNKYYFQSDYYSALSNYTQAIELNSKNIIAYRLAKAKLLNY